MTSQARADLTLAVIAAIWGSTFVMVKGALDDVSVLLFLALRFSIGAIALILMFFKRIQVTRLQITRQGLHGGILAGLFLILGYILQTAGLRYTTASKSGFLTGLYIVLVPLLGALVYKNVPGWREWFGIGLAAAGMALMTLDGARLEIGQGDALTIACAFAFAAHILVLGHWSKQISTELLSVLQIATGAVVCWIFLPILETPVIRWTPQLLVALAVTGLVATAFVFAAQTWAQRHTTATRTALIFSLEPVFAAITGYLLAGERFTMQSLAGALLILTGILRVELKPPDTGHNL